MKKPASNDAGFFLYNQDIVLLSVLMMISLRHYAIGVALFCIGFLVQGSQVAESRLQDLDFKQWFGNRPGTFVLYDTEQQTYVIHNLQRAQQRFSPCSTFKIPHSIIALETGIIPNPNQTYPWNPKSNPPQSYWTPQLQELWGKGHSMALAFGNSTIWFYQNIATQVGKRRMTQYLHSFQYGNQNVSGNITDFWLNGKLAISAVEEVQFLDKVYSGKLPIKAETIEQLKTIMITEDTPQYRLGSKTGLNLTQPGKTPFGWYVGFIETKSPEKHVYFFATNLEGKTYEDVSQARKQITQKAISALLLN